MSLRTTFHKVTVGTTMGLSTLGVPSLAIAQVPKDNVVKAQNNEPDLLERLDRNFRRNIKEDPILLSIVAISLLYLILCGGINYLTRGKEIINLSGNGFIDADKEFELFLEVLNKKTLSKEDQFEIKAILANIISSVERVQKLTDKDLTMGDKPQMRAIFFELDEALNKLWIYLKQVDRIEQKQEQDNLDKTAIKILKPEQK